MERHNTYLLFILDPNNQSIQPARLLSINAFCFREDSSSNLAIPYEKSIEKILTDGAITDDNGVVWKLWDLP